MEPDSLNSESPRVPAAVNLAIAPGVPDPLKLPLPPPPVALIVVPLMLMPLPAVKVKSPVKPCRLVTREPFMLCVTALVSPSWPAVSCRPCPKPIVPVAPPSEATKPGKAAGPKPIKPVPL